MKFRIAWSGMVAFAVSMGFGRFALTPQIPHMIAENRITLTQASLLAGSNYLGYIIGALDMTRGARDLAFRLKSSLWASSVFLLLSALIPHGTAGWVMNLALRFVAGVASAWAIVVISTWIQKSLADHHALRSFAFSGPGIGIMLSGLIAYGVDCSHGGMAAGWWAYGIVSLLAVFMIQRYLPTEVNGPVTGTRFHLTRSRSLLLGSFSLSGLGYILPATFLSKMAVDQFPGSLMADIFWPIFGLAMISGLAVLALLPPTVASNRSLATVLWMQAIGILACTLIPGIPGLLLGAILVGASYLTNFQFTVRAASELAPDCMPAFAGLLTTGFAVFQFIGPLLSAASTHFTGSLKPALLLSGIASSTAGVLALLTLQ